MTGFSGFENLFRPLHSPFLNPPPPFVSLPVQSGGNERANQGGRRGGSLRRRVIAVTPEPVQKPGRREDQALWLWCRWIWLRLIPLFTGWASHLCLTCHCWDLQLYLTHSLMDLNHPMTVIPGLFFFFSPPSCRWVGTSARLSRRVSVLCLHILFSFSVFWLTFNASISRLKGRCSVGTSLANAAADHGCCALFDFCHYNLRSQLV